MLTKSIGFASVALEGHDHVNVHHGQSGDVIISDLTSVRECVSFGIIVPQERIGYD